MNNNQKVLNYFAGALLSFVVAALFQYVFQWGVSVFVTLSALSLLFCVTAPQSVDHYMPGGLRIFLLVIALAAGFTFAMFFMSWTLLAIYMVAIIAMTVFAISRA